MKKSWIMLACALMIISGVAFGTIAYLTDTAGVTNRFTVGNVDIVVDETEVDANGNPVQNPNEDPGNPDDDYLRTEGENTYPLIPGNTYPKDPTMTVKAGSEESYVRMVVTVSNAAEIKAILGQLAVMYPGAYTTDFEPSKFVTGHDNAVWVFHGIEEDTTANTFTLEFRYYDIVSAPDADVVLPALFETITIPGELNNEHLKMLEGFYIEVKGHAIQTTGFADADAAWAAFDAQMEAESNLPANGNGGTENGNGGADEGNGGTDNNDGGADEGNGGTENGNGGANEGNAQP